MVELLMRLDGQRIENVLYFRQADSYDDTELLTLAGEVAAWYTDNILPHLSSALTLVAVKATSLESDTAPAVEVPVSGSPSGGSGDPPLPSNCALVVKFLTAGRGRSSRGRNYIPAIPKTQESSNDINPTVAASLLDGYDILRDVGVITEGAHSVVSRFLDGVERSPGIAQLVTGVTFTDLTLDSQRRRLPGRGT
jgi:hypothetical protein